MKQQPLDACAATDRPRPARDASGGGTKPKPDTALEERTARILRRIGIASDDGDLITAFVPFVIHREFLHTIPPLASLPREYVVSSDARPGSGAPAVTDRTFYRNIPLAPIPVLSPALASFLIPGEDDLEVAFVDGQNVYGANLFEQHEGRRLLRRAVGYLSDELSADGDVDVISYESDGFLISRRRQDGRSLAGQLWEIIARMTGHGLNLPARNAARARLGTFYRFARANVLAPASVAYEPRPDLIDRVPRLDVYSGGPLRDRFSRIEETDGSFGPLLDGVGRWPVHEQALALTLMESALYDHVLQNPSDRRIGGKYPARAFADPGPLLRRAQSRNVSFHRLDFVSLLKSVNEHPLGGFEAGNEALRAVYGILVTAFREALSKADADPGCEICTFRRWGEFYFGVDEDVVAGTDVAAAIERAFEKARYLAIGREAGSGCPPCVAAVLETCPFGASSRLIVPLMPTVMPETRLSDDMLSMPVEQASHKMIAIRKRLARAHAPEVDVEFLANWTFNACDVKRGIPRLVNHLNATEHEIQVMAGYYESYVSRRGRHQHRIRREQHAIRGFEGRLKEMMQAASCTWAGSSMPRQAIGATHVRDGR